MMTEPPKQGAERTDVTRAQGPLLGPLFGNSQVSISGSLRSAAASFSVQIHRM